MESNKAGFQEKEKDTQREMMEEKGMEKCKDPQKDPQGRQYFTETVTGAGKRDTPKEDVRKWEKGSKETAIRVGNKDTHGISALNTHTAREREKEE